MSSDVKRILVADDGQVMRTVLNHKLSQEGYEVVCAADGREALQLLSQYGFDLVLLDIGMPEMDGIETLEQIRRYRSPLELPAIMATAEDKEEEIVKCFEKGANDFISKPISFPILFARLNTHLKLRDAMRELQNLNRK